ncbi:ROK family transcriptional regulator [Actinokineospora sp. HUAS TT18]|uniref:ROK family transcriptional regulator n=1 Tax=Actinokineospora sp. HUAS TT18 TaxID=3447451 RepID=UPI003F51DD57
MAGRPMSAPGMSVGEVFQLLREGQAETRSDIARLTGLSRTAVSLRVNQLIEHRLVVERAEGGSTGGRPPVRLEFHATGAVVLAAAVGASRAQFAVCDLAGRILASSAVASGFTEGPDAALAAVIRQLDGLLVAAGRTHGDVRGIGVSIPGVVDRVTGRIVSRPVAPGWDKVEVPEVLGARFPVPVVVENDVNVLALAEHKAQPAIDDLVMIKASTGVGVAIIADGRLVRGAVGASGEIGHTKIGGDRVCRCGATGCLEAYAGGWALARELGVADARAVGDLVRARDPRALRAIRDAGRRIGEVVSGVVNLLNPAAIVVSGDIVSDGLVAGIRELAYQQSTDVATRGLTIEASTLDDQAALAACVVMILDDLLSPDAIDNLASGKR